MKFIVRLTVLIGLFIGHTYLASAQNVCTKTYYSDGERPELKTGGGMAALVAAVQKNLVYPVEARRAQVEGRVFISFTVLVDGRIQDVQLLKSLRTDCDGAALQAVWQLPRLKPGKQLGQPVASQCMIPVTFSLTAQNQ